jgi:hypothetical protein
MSDEQVAMDGRWAREVISNPPPRRQGNWKPLGACGPVFAETGEDVWFGPDQHDSGTQIPKETADRARRVCRRCPVRAECLLAAMETDDQHGIWGGLTPYQRTRIKTDQAAKAAGREVVAA